MSEIEYVQVPRLFLDKLKEQGELAEALERELRQLKIAQADAPILEAASQHVQPILAALDQESPTTPDPLRGEGVPPAEVSEAIANSVVSRAPAVLNESIRARPLARAYLYTAMSLLGANVAALPPPHAPLPVGPNELPGPGVIRSPIRYDEIWETACALVGTQDLGATASQTIAPEHVQMMMEGVEIGMRRKRAAALVGFPAATFNQWFRHARSRKEPYLTLFQLFEVAEARTEAALTAAWMRNANDSWQAAQQLLSKRFRDDWGEEKTIHLTARQLQSLPDEELDQLVEAIVEDNDDTDDNRNMVELASRTVSATDDDAAETI